MVFLQAFQGALIRRSPLELTVFILVVAVTDIDGFREDGAGIDLGHIIGADADGHQLASHVARVHFLELCGNLFQLRGAVCVFDLHAAGFHPILAHVQKSVVA